MASWTNNLKELCFPLSAKGTLERPGYHSLHSRKKIKRPNQLKREDFATPGRLNRRTRELRAFETPAAQMYTGDGHLRLMNGARDLRHTFGQGIVDVRIISLGYGLLNEEDLIVPYDYDFSDDPIWKIKPRSNQLKIHSKIECSLSRYDLAFFLLSKKYVTACLLPFVIQNPAEQIFLVSESDQDIIPRNRPHIHTVCAGRRLIAQLGGATNYKLKGAVFERLCKVACNRRLEVFDEGERNPPTEGGAALAGASAHQVFEEVKRNPQGIIEMVLDCNRRL